MSALGADKLRQIPDESTGGDDAQFEKLEESLVTLSKVSDASGSVKVDKINQRPLKQEMLDTNECFILDTQQSDVYVWVGRKANAKEKAEAMKKAEDIKKSKHYPSWTKVQRVVQNAEPSIFRQYFHTWQGVGESRPRILRDVSSYDSCIPQEPKLYHLKEYGSKVFVKNVNRFSQYDLMSDDVMIVDDGCKIYVWFGKYSSEYERIQSLRPTKVNIDYFYYTFLQ